MGLKESSIWFKSNEKVCILSSGMAGKLRNFVQHVYVADRANHRVMRWSHGKRVGVLVAGGNGFGQGAHQLGCPGAVRIWSVGGY